MERYPSGSLGIESAQEGNHIAAADKLANDKLSVGSYRALGSESFPVRTSPVVGHAALEGFRMIADSGQSLSGLTAEIAGQYLEDILISTT